MTWQPVPHQPLYPPMEEMKELLNIPNTFQTPLPSKQHIYTEWSGKPSNLVEGPRKQSMTSTNESAPWRDGEKRSMDDLWRSVPSKKTSRLDSGRSTKPYSRTTQTTREKPRLSQRLGLPPSLNPRKKSLAERLGVPLSSTPWTPIPPAENHLLPEEGSASEPQPSLLQRLQPLPLLQCLKSPN
jgi:hypothetical protein